MPARAKFPSSAYTACVHDVAVGNLDMCVPGRCGQMGCKVGGSRYSSQVG